MGKTSQTQRHQENALIAWYEPVVGSHRVGLEFAWHLLRLVFLWAGLPSVVVALLIGAAFNVLPAALKALAVLWGGLFGYFLFMVVFFRVVPRRIEIGAREIRILHVGKNVFPISDITGLTVCRDAQGRRLMRFESCDHEVCVALSPKVNSEELTAVLETLIPEFSICDDIQ